MKSFVSKLVFATVLFVALLGTCRSGFATTLHPGDVFDFSYDMELGVPPEPYITARWGLYLLTDKSVVINGSIRVDIFDSGNTLLASTLANFSEAPWPSAFYPEFFWVSAINQTNDPQGHVRFTSVSATFDADLSRSSIVLWFLPAPIGAAIPLPAALPLFASGLGVFGLLGWRRKRKDAAANRR